GVKVYSIDVGYGQLAWKLRQDSRVVVMERVNARYLKPEDFNPTPSFASMDVSFISQRLILPVIPLLLEIGGTLISLIKPQFECGRKGLSKNGIVRDWRIRRRAVQDVVECAASVGLAPVGLILSPVLGGDGNMEFLLCCSLGGVGSVDNEKILEVCRQ
ncbi:MAG: TlyA family rRNA (cytidine-2'-O)-methyltransferase, partial [Clostridiales bacterium]|nr:TlyA family rRNA (cytidine-2'-O)-methyltransferase [Clostridiales bacterium]